MSDQDQLRLKMQMEEEEAQGGAEGGPGGGELPQLLPHPKPLSEYEQGLERLRAKMANEGAMNSLAHGQGLSTIDPKDAEAFRNRHTTGAAAEMLAMARGVPFVGAHLDELAGAAQSGHLSGPEYERKRDEARQTMDAATHWAPSGPTMGSLAFAPMLPATAPGRIAFGTLAGASEGAGDAPTLKEAPKMSLMGGGTGLATSLLGEAAIQGGKMLGDKRDLVLLRNKAKSDALIDKGVKSVIGTVGQKEAEAAAALRSLEERASATTGDPAVRERARQLLDSEYANQLRDQIAEGYMRRFHNLAPGIADARTEMTDYLTNTASPEGRAAAAQARIDDPSALLRRIRELGPKVVLPVVGGAIAGPAGAGAGALSGAVLGRSATTVKNMMTDPYVASRVLGAGSAVGQGTGSLTTAMSPDTSKRMLDLYLEERAKQREAK